MSRGWPRRDRTDAAQAAAPVVPAASERALRLDAALATVEGWQAAADVRRESVTAKRDAEKALARDVRIIAVALSEMVDRIPRGAPRPRSTRIDGYDIGTNIVSYIRGYSGSNVSAHSLVLTVGNGVANWPDDVMGLDFDTFDRPRWIKATPGQCAAFIDRLDKIVDWIRPFIPAENRVDIARLQRLGGVARSAAAALEG